MSLASKSDRFIFTRAVPVIFGDLEFYSQFDNPYTDLITFIFVPSILGFGLFVAFAGALWERRRRRRIAPEDLKPFPIFDLNDPARRRSLIRRSRIRPVNFSIRSTSAIAANGCAQIATGATGHLSIR